MECEIKWALGSITPNKASGGDGIPVELYQILKDDAVKVLHSTCQQIWKTQEWPQDWKRSVFIPTPKKGNGKECSNYHTIALISHATKVVIQILQARLQQYVNRAIPDVQPGFRKGRGTRDQIANICWIIEKAREFRKKKSISARLTMPKPLTVWITINWKILKEMGIQDHLTVASWPAYRFLKRHVRWSGIPISFRIFPQFIVIHTVKGFGIVNKTEIDVFLELSCCFDDLADVGHLISGSSAFSKTSLNIWKFVIHVLLKPGLGNFEHYFTSMWDECNCVVVWAFFGIAFLWD